MKKAWANPAGVNGNKPIHRDTGTVTQSVMQFRRMALVAAVIVSGACGQAEAETVVWGAAGSFAVLGSSTVTSTGSTTIDGDLGVSPGTAITGFPPGTVVNGTIYAGNAAAQAQSDAAAVYGILEQLALTQDMTGQGLGGQTLTAGVYSFSAEAQLTGTLTLDGPGQFVFQIGSTLTTASAASIEVINGANAANIFFLVGSSATLGTDTAFLGNIIALASDTLNTGASVEGRVIALTGSVTLDNNNILLPIPEPGTAGLMVFGVLVFLAFRRPDGKGRMKAGTPRTSTRTRQ